MRGAPATCMSSSLPRVSEAPLPDCQTQAILRIGSGPSKVIRPHSAGTFEIDPGAKRPCPGSGDPHTLQLLGSCATDAHPRRRPVLRQAHRLLPGTLELARPLRGRARPPAAAFRGPSPPPPPKRRSHIRGPAMGPACVVLGRSGGPTHCLWLPGQAVAAGPLCCAPHPRLATQGATLS